MDQQNSDQGWQQLQANIENYFYQTITSDVPRLEYKPRFIALLEMSSEHHLHDLQETGI